MNNKDLETTVQAAFSHATPDVLDAVLADCSQGKGQVIHMTETKKKTNLLKIVSGIAAALVLVVAGVVGVNAYRQNAVDSVISLEVNPSLKIETNREEQVLRVLPLNDDAKKVIGDMDFESSDLEVTVNALIGSMLREGFLNVDANSILVSVENDDTAIGDALRKKLAVTIKKTMNGANDLPSAVISQQVKHTDELDALAEKHNITVGKAQLIQKIVEQDPSHTFEELATLSIHELNLISNKEQAPIGEVTFSGKPSEMQYIGHRQAKKVALDHAGFDEKEVGQLEAEPDYEDGVLVYEVEFKVDGFEYDYTIHATDGTVISSHKEADDDAMNTDTVPPTSSDKPQTLPPATSKPSATGVTPTSKPTATTIDREAAIRIALTHAGVAADNATGLECEPDTEDGRLLYEVEFDAGGYEYSYDIDADTGAILYHEKERDD